MTVLCTKAISVDLLPSKLQVSLEFQPGMVRGRETDGFLGVGHVELHVQWQSTFECQILGSNLRRQLLPMYPELGKVDFGDRSTPMGQWPYWLDEVGGNFSPTKAAF